MADIFHEFTVNSRPQQVFQYFSTTDGLDKWWTKKSSGAIRNGGDLRLFFGPQYDWSAKVTRYVPPSAFELQITNAHPDWMGTLVGCELLPQGDHGTRVRFYHTGWPEQNEHWRVSCFCWAMYLRILRRSVEYGETDEYERRLDA